MPLPEATLRAATPEDAPAIAQLEPEIFGTTAWSEGMVRDELTAPHRTYVVLVAGEAIIGYAGVLCIGIEADVQTIALTREARGRGFGRLLLTTLIDEARARHAEQFFLEVREDNEPAMHLYQQFGLQPIARREGYYQPDNVDAIVMHLALVDTTTEEEHS